MKQSELRLLGILGTSLPASNPKQQQRYAVWVMLQAPRYASLVLACQGAPDREEDDSAWPPNPKKSRTRMP